MVKIKGLLESIRVLKAKEKCLIFIFSLLFSAIQICGNKINLFSWPYFQDFGAGDIGFFCVQCLVSFVFVGCLFVIVRRKLQQGASEKSSLPLFKDKEWMYPIAVFVGQLPWWLIYYPGGVGVDTLTSIRQALGIIPLKNDNPLLHTISLIPFVKIGEQFHNMNFAVAIYVLFQMITISLVIGRCLFLLETKVENKVEQIMLLLFYAANPIISVFAISIIKDTFFSVFVFALMIELMFIVENKEAEAPTMQRIVWYITLILVAFSRLNGFLVVFMTVFSLAVLNRRKHKIIRFSILLLFVTAFIMYGPVYSFFGVDTPRAATEALGVQLQQVCYTVVSEGDISSEDMVVIESLVLKKEDIYDAYKPYTVDGIKFYYKYQNEKLNGNVSKFLSTWWRVGKRNPLKYLKAWLMETVGYYHIELTPVPFIFSISENEFGIVTHSYQPLQKIVTWVQARIAKLCSIGLMMTCVFICILFVALNGDSSTLVIFVPAITIWLSLMIGAPTYGEFRYVFPIFLGIPVFYILTKQSFIKMD